MHKDSLVVIHSQTSMLSKAYKVYTHTGKLLAQVLGGHEVYL